ncbi:MAG: tetratricopeptide repeat protein [Gammaproteobacteria bacterium]|nr:tetratricopeptide repeat protein [Gammaproteobacteria bacterium]
MGFRKGRQYATTWVKKAEDARGGWNGYLTIGGKEYRPIDCYVEALKRDPEYAEAWYKLGLKITEMSAGEDTDKKLVGMDLFKDEPKITDNKRLHYAHINAAKFCFDKAIEIEPKNEDAWYGKGSWCLDWRPPDLNEGIECFLEVTKLYPKHKAAWYDLANAYAKRMHDGDIAEAVKCYDEAIALSPDNSLLYAKKADLFSECVKQREYFYRGTDSDLKKKYSSGKDALMYYDKAIEIGPKVHGYASYKKGMLLERLSRYEEALECFENNGGYDRENGVPVMNSNKLHRLALRDKLKPHEAGSTESFEIYCNVLENFFKDDELSEVEYARKKLNENILQRIHKLGDDVTEEDVYEMAEWLQNTDREKEALELYDKEIEKSLEKGDLYNAASVNDQKARCLDDIGRTKDAFDCWNKTIQFCEEFFKKTQKKDSGLGPEYYLAQAYASNAHTFKDFGNMDKAIEYIDHAIKLELEHEMDDYYDFWEVKMGWLPDEEAIKFLDKEIKALGAVTEEDEDGKNHYIEGMEYARNKLLKKLAK